MVDVESAWSGHKTWSGDWVTSGMLANGYHVESGLRGQRDRECDHADEEEEGARHRLTASGFYCCSEAPTTRDSNIDGRKDEAEH